jgi:hypothetical protein
VSPPATRLRSISPSATPDEVAAIVAALEMCARPVVGSGGEVDDPGVAGEPRAHWVRGARLTARRAGLQRGPWRLSGRIGRRSRA